MPVPPTTRLLTPEEIAVQAGQQAAYLRLPERTLFAEREMRLRERAAGHPMRDFLLFMADVAHAQHTLMSALAAPAPPDAGALDAAARAGLPPLPAETWRRDPAWRDGLRALVADLQPRLAASPALAGVSAVQRAARDDVWVDQQADRLLNAVMPGLDLAAAPLVAAALQVHWTQLVLATQDARGADRLPPFGRTDDATRCPCCGSRPVASISRIGPDTGFRYLQCALCSVQWHMVRIKCSHCQSTKGIHYQSLQRRRDDTPGATQAPVEAETCDECGHYLKIVHMERDANVEPVADDLASVTLDLLVSEAGFQRHGVNLMLLFGDPDTAQDTPRDDGGGA